MELLKAIFLGAVQGITEFLPVSSTGHLILAESILGIDQNVYGLAFDAALHIGTLFAVLWFFKDEWLRLFAVILNTVKNLIRIKAPVIKTSSLDSSGKAGSARDDELIWLLLIGTIPAVIIGLLLEDTVDTLFRSPQLVGVMLILFSFVLLYVEKVGNKLKKMEKLSSLDACVIGVAQSIALIPGVSRSGITMAAGMWRGLTRGEAARFAFLLSAPIVAGAGGKKVLETFSLFLDGQLGGSDISFFIVGMISAAIFGYLTIKYFLQFLTTKTLYPFIYYRIILGLLIILFLR